MPPLRSCRRTSVGPAAPVREPTVRPPARDLNRRGVAARGPIGYPSRLVPFIRPSEEAIPMSDTLSETEGCGLLARLFRSRGYSIQRNVLFQEYGVSFHADGWDPHARVGFEFLTSEDDDHDDLSLEEYKTLNMAQQRGELSLFIIDEVEPLSAQALADEANEFLDEVAEAAQARRLAAARRAKAVIGRGAAAAKGSAPGKPAAKPVRKAVKKTALKPAAAAKKPAKKPAGKKAAAAKQPAVKKQAAARPARRAGR